MLDGQLRDLQLECSQRYRVHPLSPRKNLLCTKQRIHLPRKNIPFFQTLLHALDKFLLDCRTLLCDTHRFIQRDHCMLRIKVIQQ